MTQTLKVPKGALRFIDVGHGASACAEMFKEGDKEKVRLNMVAYSGKPITGHWYWDTLAIDGRGVKFNGKFPILEDHNESKKIAFSNGAIIGKDGSITIDPDKSQFVDTEYSKEFQKLSAEGFPYQSSIYAKPTRIERIEEGAFAEVNGYKLKGPAAIWRECQFKEASVCVFGWDSKTKSSAFSREVEEDVDLEEDVTIEAQLQQEPASEGKEVKEKMKLEDLLKEHPELVAQIRKEATDEAQKQFSEKETAMTSQITTLKEDNEKMSTRVMGLEKQEAIRAENELKHKALTIWQEMLSASLVPERLYPKVQLHVSHDRFMADGKFDEEKFREAVKSEIKDWEDRGATTEVMGSSFNEKDIDDTEGAGKNEMKEKEVKTLVNQLRSGTGMDAIE